MEAGHKVCLRAGKKEVKAILIGYQKSSASKALLLTSLLSLLLLPYTTTSTQTHL